MCQSIATAWKNLHNDTMKIGIQIEYISQITLLLKCEYEIYL